MTSNSNRTIFPHRIIIIIVLLVVAGIIGYNIGKRERILGPGVNASVNYTGTKPPAGVAAQVDFGLFWDVWDRLSRSYIDKKALDAQKMVYGAVKGMVASLDDPYTVFLPPKENKEAKDDLGGQFEGIGAQLGVKDKRIIVIAPLKGTPAERVGIKSGDWVVKVDAKETADWTLPETVAKIRGQKGSSVLLTILHEKEDKTVDISITRDAIHVASVEWDKVNVKCTGEGCEIIKTACNDCGHIAHLKLYRFGDKTMDEWQTAVNQIESDYKKGEIKGIVLDLRNNPGGYLQAAISIASEFLRDKTVVSQQNNDGSKNVYQVNKVGKLLSQALVVVVNKGSASASEIVAGALKVRGRAKLVGQKTFGKGSVQDTQDLPNGAGLHVTVARWLLPDDTWINGQGVTPDVVVEMDEKNPERDPQLEKAISVLLQ